TVIDHRFPPIQTQRSKAFVKKSRWRNRCSTAPVNARPLCWPSLQHGRSSNPLWGKHAVAGHERNEWGGHHRETMSSYLSSSTTVPRYDGNFTRLSVVGDADLRYAKRAI